MNSLYSHFDTNPIKEYETLDLEQRLLKGINIQFSYYPIISREIQRKPGMIYSIYRGNTTQPNVILNDKNYFPTYYQTSELCIYGNQLHEGSHSAELVVKHEPVSSSVEPLYVCFFLHKNAPPQTPQQTPQQTPPQTPHKNAPHTSKNFPMESFESPATQVKLIIESKDTVEINLSSFLEPYQVFTNEIQTPNLPVNWKLYKSTTRENGKSCFVVLIEKPIWIDSLTFDKIPTNTKTISPFITYNDSIFASNVNETTNKDSFNYKEGFVQVRGGGYALNNSNDNQMVCEVIDDNINENQEINFYQVPVGGNSNKTQEKMNTLLAGLYLIIGSVFVASTMVLMPRLFDASWQGYLQHFGINPTFFVYGCTVGITIIALTCIGIGTTSKPPDTGLVLIGVGIATYGFLATIGTMILSEVIKKEVDRTHI